MQSNEFEERGILTQADIEFLMGEREKSDSAESNAKRRIQNRVAAAMHDFEILLEYWSDDQYLETVRKIEDSSSQNLGELGSDMIAFSYVMSNVKNTEPERVKDENTVRKLLSFRTALNLGIQKGRKEFDNSPGPVSIAATTDLHEVPDPEAVRDELSLSEPNEILDKMRDKFLESEAYEERGEAIDNSDQVEDLEEAIRLLYHEWFEQIVSKVSKRRMRTDDFVIHPKTPVTSQYGYREDFDFDSK